MAKTLTHFDDEGRPRMVDVSTKADAERTARATGTVRFSDAAYADIRAHGVAKGDILRIAELAGIMGAKKTADLIPLCHPLPLTAIAVAGAFNDATKSIDVEASVRTTGKTGVEMEALTAVAVACLAVYDMAKSVDKAMTIGPIALVEKTGGKSGDFRR